MRVINNKQGLTLIEVIVALAVIIIGVVAGLTLTVYNLKASTFGEQQLVSSNLARESIEVVRSMRDANWLKDEEWSKDVFAAGQTKFVTMFDEVDGSWSIVATDAADVKSCADCQIYLNQENGVYSHDPSKTQTIYKRLLSVKEICWLTAEDREVVEEIGETCASEELEQIGWELTSTVYFSLADRERETKVVDRLYNWR